MRRIMHRARGRFAALTLGGVVALGGCDPDVRDTVLGGVETASTSLLATFVTAFFETLQEPEDAPATVKLLVEESLPIG